MSSVFKISSISEFSNFWGRKFWIRKFKIIGWFLKFRILCNFDKFEDIFEGLGSQDRSCLPELPLTLVTLLLVDKKLLGMFSTILL